MNDLRAQYADRLRRLWMSMHDAMSQGGTGKIFVSPVMADDIRAAEVLARREWRPIDTAPANDTRVLLKFPGPFSDPTERGIAVGARSSNRDGWWVSCIWASSSDHHKPTHWMPLPSEPEARHSDDRVQDGDKAEVA